MALLRALIVSTALAVSCVASAAAQSAPPPPAPAPDAPSAPDAATGAAPYSYAVDGRRDPFESLTATSSDEKTPRPAGGGIAAIRVDELSVRGIMRSRDRLVAMVAGPDNRTYVVHQGDKLADGVIKSINPQGLVLMQNVDEPRAREKTREVRKLLRSADEKE
jgi:Tfp pilus assembly protein PilP